MTLARIVALVALTGATCVAYGSLIERRWYRLRRLRVPGTLRTKGTLRILHLSDLHLIPGQNHRRRFLQSLATLDHDLVVVTGDLLGSTDAEDLAVDSLAPLVDDDRPGVVVLGSNDFVGPVRRSPLHYFVDRRRHRHRSDRPVGDSPRTAKGADLDTPRLIAGLERSGYRVLRNTAAVVQTPAGAVAVGGIDDPHMPGTVLPSAAEVAAATADTPDIALGLGVVHAPYKAALDVLVEAGHDLLVAGHTHGGQVRIPGIGALVANCDLPLRQARGLSKFRGRALHVSVGLGHSRYAPFRFACRPEATLLELTG